MCTLKLSVVCLRVDATELQEVREDAVKVASKKHESAIIVEQSKQIDLQSLLDSREEASCVTYLLLTCGCVQKMANNGVR